MRFLCEDWQKAWDEANSCDKSDFFEGTLQ